MAENFTKMLSWEVSGDIHKLADIPVCPYGAGEPIDDDSGMFWKLLLALCEGQERGSVNHYECHAFFLIDVDRGDSFLSSLVWNVPHQTYEVYVFLKQI